MKRTHILYAATTVWLLAACTPEEIATAQTDISTGILAACSDVMAAQKLNPTSPVAPYATGACATAPAVAALVQNSGTLQWLGTIQGQLAATAPGAPVAAPAASP